ncbi:predicted protein, partial [Nematostella vectensis]
FEAGCLAEHNKYRVKHGASPLQWDSTLAAHARAWASKLASGAVPPGTHDMESGEGENIAWAESQEITCELAVQAWMDELNIYKSDGYCANPPSMPDHNVMHFTQIVWKSTTKVGVAKVGVWLVARYDPPGNWGGEFGSKVQC